MCQSTHRCAQELPDVLEHPPKYARGPPRYAWDPPQLCQSTLRSAGDPPRCFRAPQDVPEIFPDVSVQPRCVAPPRPPFKGHIARGCHVVPPPGWQPGMVPPPPLLSLGPLRPWGTLQEGWVAEQPPDFWGGRTWGGGQHFRPVPQFPHCKTVPQPAWVGPETPGWVPREARPCGWGDEGPKGPH